MTDVASLFEITLVPALACHEPWQALFLLPDQYVDLSRLVTDLASVRPNDGTALVRGTVSSKVLRSLPKANSEAKARSYLSVGLADARCEIRFETYHVSDWSDVVAGDVVTVLGRVRATASKGVHLVDAVRETHRPEPRVVYKGVSSKVAGSRIELAAQSAVLESALVNQAACWFSGTHPVLAALTEKHWGSVESLLRALHAPRTLDEGERALQTARRLCVVEIRHKARLHRSPGASILPFPELRRLVWSVLQKQPERLSAGQINALKVAVPALSGVKPAHILLNGDVGSGKTLVYLGLAGGFAESGRTVAILAPNGRVAQQIYRQCMTRCPSISVRLVMEGKVTGPENALITIGTTSLLFSAPAREYMLVIIDEEQRFSRQQREGLLSPGSHLLEVSATPLPRSLALGMFDGSVVAQINSPPMQRMVRTHLLSERERSDVVRMHLEAIAKGKRVVYLYAAVHGSAVVSEQAATGRKPKDNVRAARQAFDELDKKFPGKVAMIHGQMAGADAEKALQEFTDGTKPNLVASSAIEVGVDIPDIALLVVRDADRFGIAQLHQMRGRVARNGGDADFVMFTKEKLSKATMDRLAAVRDVNDGFALAERDLLMRGFGDVAGERQAGVGKTAFQLSQLSSADFFHHFN